MTYYHRHFRVRRTHPIDSTNIPSPIDQSTSKTSDINYMVNHFLKTGTVPPSSHRGEGRYLDQTALPNSRAEALTILKKIQDVSLRDLVKKWYDESQSSQTTTTQTTTTPKKPDSVPSNSDTPDKRTAGTPADVNKP